MTSLAPQLEADLRAFVAAVKASPHNLVSRRAREELWDRHVLESLAFARMLPRDEHLLDIGSGGGFPGVVIAAARPDLDVTLLDSSTKKVTFLSALAVELDVAYRVLHGRAEDIATVEGAARFGLVTARAVAPMHRLLGWTMPFLKSGGLLYAIKGQTWATELEEGREQLDAWRAEVVATPDDLPRDDDNAPMVVVVKRGVAR